PAGMEMHVGKAYMLDRGPSAHMAWDAVMVLEDDSVKAAARTLPTSRTAGQAYIVWTKDAPLPDGATDYPFWAEWLAQDRVGDSAPVKAFDESKIKRWPKGTPVDEASGAGGGRF